MSVQAREPSLFEALLVLVLLVIFIGGSVYLFGDNATSGPFKLLCFASPLLLLALA